MTNTNDPAEVLRLGIRACREDRWREGLDYLTRLAVYGEAEGRLPGVYYSYLGHAIARCEGRRREGLDLCRHAVEKEPFRPENHLNLGAVLGLVGNRRAALRSLRNGLALDPDHRGLKELHRRLGVRQKPPIPFLARSNPINRFIGLWRHQIAQRKAERLRRRAEEAELNA